MRKPEAREEARAAVRAALARRSWNHTDLQKESGLDPGTVGDFLNGARWPKIKTQARIEAALGWPAGTLGDIEMGRVHADQLRDRDEGVDGDEDRPLTDAEIEREVNRLPGLSQAQRDGMIAVAKAWRSDDDLAPRRQRRTGAT